MATVIYDHAEPHEVASDATDGGHLWLSPAELEAITRWVVKPEGLCRDDACVPLPPDGSWTDARGRIDLAAFASRQGRPSVRDTDRDVWAFAPTTRATGGAAPDFAFPDLDGQTHSLSDYRGSKVFLYTWGSYCGCSFDPPVWETVYQELKDSNLEMISVALDAAGPAARTGSAPRRSTNCPRKSGGYGDGASNAGTTRRRRRIRASSTPSTTWP